MIEECIAEDRIWMISPLLLTNDTKTEFFIIGSYQQLSKVSIESIAVGTSVINLLSVSVISWVHGLTITCL